MYDRNCLIRDASWLFERMYEPIDQTRIGQLVQDAEAVADGRQLYHLANAIWLGIVEYAGEHADLVTATVDRDVILDAMVRIDSGAWLTGREAPPIPSAGGVSTEAPVLWAIARRNALTTLARDALADECRAILSRAQESEQNLTRIIATARQRDAAKMSLIGGQKHKHKPLVDAALREVGKTLREQHISAKGACDHLAKHPVTLANGIVVKGNRDARKIEVSRGQQRELLAVRSAERFRKDFMRKVPS